MSEPEITIDENTVTDIELVEEMEKAFEAIQ